MLIKKHQPTVSVFSLCPRVFLSSSFALLEETLNVQIQKVEGDRHENEISIQRFKRFCWNNIAGCSRVHL